MTVLVFMTMWCVIFASPKLSFDFVVVGSGAGGATVASRLAEQYQVLLIEKGPYVDDDVFQDIVFLNQSVASWVDPRISLNYTSTPQSALNGRRLDLPRAGVVGGCTSHNEGVWLLGDERALFSWPSSSSWITPYYRAALSRVSPIQLNNESSFWTSLIANTSSNAGYYGDGDGDDDDDYLHSSQRVMQLTTSKAGRRKSSWTQYVKPWIETSNNLNLTLMWESEVIRIDVDNNNNNNDKCVGVLVNLKHLNQNVSIAVNYEVIISAGAYDTPKLLMLSGIGDFNTLPPDVDRVANVAGVGVGLGDHVFLPLVSPALKKVLQSAPPDEESALYGDAGIVLYDGSVDDAADHYVHITLAEGNNSGNFTYNPSPYRALEFDLEFFPSVNDGYVRISSSNYSAPPIIDHRVLQPDAVMQRFLYLVNKTRALMHSPPFAALYDESLWPEGLPGPKVQTPEQLQDFVAAYAASDFHPCCSAQMGKVVDERLNVIGIKGLRIVDASILPQNVAGNLQATVYAIGEKAAQLILEDYGWTRPPLNAPSQFVAKVHAVVGSVSRPSLYGDFINQGVWPQGTLFYDGGNRRALFQLHVDLPRIGHLDIDFLQLPDSGYQTLNEVCRIQNQIAYNASVWWDWLSSPQTRVAYDDAMAVATFSADKNATFYRADFFWDPSNGWTPLFLFSNVSVVLAPNVIKPLINIVYFDQVEWVAPPSSVFQVDSSCNTKGLICPWPSSPINLTLYTFEPCGDLFASLDNEDAADLLGDSAFGCVDIATGGSTWDVSCMVYRWNVTISSFGQYSFCNLLNCLGNNDYDVGREASFALGPHASQCLHSGAPLGYWFSFRTPGKCAANQAVGDGCTWKPAGPPVSIKLTCLQSLGFEQACSDSFQAAAKIFESAFEQCPLTEQKYR